MTASSNQTFIDAINDLTVPVVGRRLGDVARVELASENGRNALNVHTLLPLRRPLDALSDEVHTLFQAHCGSGPVEFSVFADIAHQAVANGAQPIPGVRNIIAVASGKGGVGKSTTAVNMALALAADGAAVGLLDADIYGPSQPRMLGIPDARPVSDDGKSFDPMQAHGIVAMSIGFLVDESQAMAWRGPMVTQALTQLLTQTRWGELDYLLVDMPPGTGDIQLTLSQKVPVSGAVIITTPQDIALVDARKGLALFRKVGVPVLGVVENMSVHTCSACGHSEEIFGHGGADQLSGESEVEVLGRLPLQRDIGLHVDQGVPSVVAEPGSAVSLAYQQCALSMVSNLQRGPVSHAHKFPKIVVEDS